MHGLSISRCDKQSGCASTDRAATDSTVFMFSSDVKGYHRSVTLCTDIKMDEQGKKRVNLLVTNIILPAYFQTKLVVPSFSLVKPFVGLELYLKCAPVFPA